MLMQQASGPIYYGGRDEVTTSIICLALRHHRLWHRHRFVAHAQCKSRRKRSCYARIG